MSPNAASATSPDFTTAVAQAEAAVAKVRDSELRKIAFDKILARLLDGDGESHPNRHGPAQPRRNTRKVAKAPNSGKPRKGPKGYIEALIADGFFGKPKTISEVRVELGNRGHHVAVTGLSGPLQSLTVDKKLRRQKMKTGETEGKGGYRYSNW
jgi:hypothetical protein